MRELDYQGVFRVDPNGTITCLTKEFPGPNGLAFSPDESVLYVGDSEDNFIKQFRVESDGSISGSELFVDQRGDTRPGAPDGMKVDTDGRLWTTGAGGISVVEPDGTVLGQIVLLETPANLAFGGPNFSTVYATAQTSVYQFETMVRGIAPGSR
jgi:gluconolactonase